MKKIHQKRRLKWFRHFLIPKTITNIFAHIEELLTTFKNTIAYNNPTIVYIAFLEMHISTSRPRNIGRQFNLSLHTNIQHLLNTLKPMIAFEMERYYSSDLRTFTIKYAEFEVINIDTPVIPINKEIMSESKLYNHHTMLQWMPLNTPLVNLMIDNRYIYKNIIVLFKGEYNGWFRYKFIDTSNYLEFEFQQMCIGNTIQTSLFYIIHHYQLNGSFLYTNVLYSPKFIKPISKTNSNSEVAGVFDIETYVDVNGSHKVYNIGLVKFKEDFDNYIGLNLNPTDADTRLKVNVETFYLSDYNNDEETLILNFINTLLKPANNKKLFYAHNLMGFDLIFLLKYLNRKGQCDILERNGEIYSVDVRYGEGNKYVLYIRDSYKLLPMSLSKLSNHFLDNVNINELITNLKYEYDSSVKDIFPYTFITDLKDLTYVGAVPSKSFFDESVTDVEYDLYKQRFTHKTKWNLKKESTKYMILDCVLLYFIIVKYNSLIYKQYNIKPIDNISISGLTYKIFLHNYLGNVQIPIISGGVYDDIRQSYYGGVCEIYKPYGENLYYYDVNSLYPYAMLNDMPGGTFYKSNNPNINTYFGFVKAKIETPTNMYMPFLPLRYDNRLFLPLGMWTGWYFSEELKYAAELGYKITVIEGYNFKKINPFKDMITKLYELKRTSDTVMRTISKLLLNNLYGRFGMNDANTITTIVSGDELNNILKNYVITSETEIDDGVHMVTYNVDYINEEIGRGEMVEPNINVAIASAITGYSRIIMDKMKRKYEKNLYYTDTDSLVLDKEIDPKMVSDEIGKLKLEHIIKKGVFPSYKMYGLINENDETIIKAKGLNSKTLTYDDIFKLYQTSELSSTMVKKFASFKDNTIYEVNTEMKILDVADKRENVYDKNNNWIGTRPYIINSNNTDNDKNK